MSLSVVASSAWAFSASTTAAAAPALPTGWAVGDLLLLAITWKQDTATVSVASTGWTLLTTQTGGTGAAAGAGTGNVVTAYYWKLAATGQLAPNINALSGGGTANTTGNVMGATVTAYRSTAGGYDVAYFKGGQNTSVTAWAPAGALTSRGGVGDTATLAVNDIIEAVHGMSLSTTTQTLHTFTATGLTVGTRTVTPTKGASTTGADLGATRFHATVTATTAAAGATITASATESAATYGSMVGVRVREAAPSYTGTAAFTGAGALNAGFKAETFSDDMSTLTNWNFTTGDFFAQSGGAIRYTDSAASTDAGRAPFTNRSYLLRDSYAVFQVTASSISAGHTLFAGLSTAPATGVFSAQSWIGFQFDATGVYQVVFGNSTSPSFDNAPPPGATWFAVRTIGSTVEHYASADGANWVRLRDAGWEYNPPDVTLDTPHGFYFGDQQIGAGAAGDWIEVSNVNTGFVSLPWLVPLTGSGTLTAAGLQLNAFSGSGTLTATGVAQYVATGNLYRDPSIEAGDGSDWAQHVGNVNFPGRATWSAVTVGDAVDGTHVLRATITTAGTFALNAPLVAGVATHAWSESFYIRQTTGTFRAHQVGLTYYDSAGTILTQSVTNVAALTGAFVRYSVNTGSRADLPTTAFVAARHVVTSAAVGDVFEYDLVQVVGASSGTTVGGGIGPQALNGSGALAAVGTVVSPASSFSDDMSTLTNWNYTAGDYFAQSGGAIRYTHDTTNSDLGRDPYTDLRYLVRDNYFVFEVSARSISAGGVLSVGMSAAPMTGGAGGYGIIGFDLTSGTSVTLRYGVGGSVRSLPAGATWLAVRSVGDALTYYASVDGDNWTTLGSAQTYEGDAASLDAPFGFYFGDRQSNAVAGDWIEVNNVNAGYTRLPWQAGATFSGTAALSGSGALTAIGTPKGTGAASPSGSGTLTVTGSPQPIIAVTLSGSGTTTTAGLVVSSAAPTGSGTVTATGKPAIPGAASPSGSGTATATGTVLGTAAPSGSGTTTTAGTPALTGTAAPNGSGTVTAAGVPNGIGATSVSGSGTLTAAGVPTPKTAAAPNGSGTLAAATGLLAITGATAAATGSGTATATGTVVASATPTGSGTTTTAGTPGLTGTAAPNGSGTLATSNPIVIASTSLSGDGTLVALQNRAVDLSGSGSVTAVGLPILTTTATVSGSGTATAVGLARFTDSVQLTGSGTLAATGVTAITGATASPNGSGTTTTASKPAIPATATPSGSGTLVAAGTPAALGTASLSGSGTLSALSGGHVVPSFVQAITNTATTGANITATLAAAPAAGSLLVAMVSQQGLDVLTAAAGWVASGTTQSGDTGTMFYKVVPPEDTAAQTICTTDVGSRAWAVVLVEYTNVDTTAGLISSTANAATGATKTTATVTPTAGLSALLVGGAYSTTATTTFSAETVNGSSTDVTERGEAASGTGANQTHAVLWDYTTTSTSGTYATAATSTLAESGGVALLLFSGVVSGGTSITSSAGLAGSGTLTAAGTPSPVGSAALSGSGATSTATLTIATSNASGSGTATATGAANLSGSGSSTGSGTGSASGAPSFVDARNLFGSGTAVASNANPKLTDSISFSALGVLAASGTPTIATTASPNGIGQVLAATAATTTGSANPSGSGTLAGQAIKVTATGTAALSGSGSDVAAGQPNFAGTCATSGSGSATGTGTPAVVASAAASGSGTTSVVSRVSFTGTANLSGSGTLSAVGSSDTSGAANTTGSGTLVGSGAASIASTAAFAGSGTVTTAGTPAIPSSAALSGSGTATTAAIVLASAAASGTGTASTSAGKPTFAIQASVSGSGTLVASAALSSTVALTGSGTLTGAGTPTVAASVPLTGLGNLSAAGATTGSTGTAQATGSGSLTATPVAVITADSVTLSGSGAVTAATKPNTSDIAHFTGSGTLSAAPVANFTGATAALSGDGSLAAAGKAIFTTTATLIGSGALTTTAALANPIVTPPLSGSGTLTASGGVSTKGVATLTSEGTLTTTVVVSFATSADLSGDSQLTLATRAAFRDITATAVPRTTWSADARLAARNAVLRATGRAAEARLNTPEAAPRNAWTARSHLEH